MAFIRVEVPERGSMATPSAQEPSGWDEDLSWLDRDPVTAEEREAWLDRLAEADEPPDPDEEDPADGGRARRDPRIRRVRRRALGRGRGPARPRAAGLGADLPGRISEPGGLVRVRAGPGRDAGLPGPGPVRRRGRRGRRLLSRRVR